MSRLGVVILAAGKGTRMRSKYQKILHEVGGKPMVAHVFDSAEKIATLPPVLVVAPDENGVQELFENRAHYVEQAERLGTGHATQMAMPLLKGHVDQVLVTYGDMPLLRAETLQRLAQTQAETGAAVVMLTVMGDSTSSFGRVLRGEDGYVHEICEVAEAKQRPNGAEILAIPELNVGLYCFSAEFLWQNLPNLPLRQARSGQEYYLTDMIEFAVQQDQKVVAITTDDPDEALGAGTRAEMVAVEAAFRQRAVRRWVDAGVTIVNPDQTYIDPDVTIGQDSIIWPNTYLQGDTIIGDDCTIGPNTIVRSCSIGDRCVIEQAVVEGVIVDDDMTILPFTHAIPLEQ